MKVMVIGSGGREHAICWKLKQSNCDIYCAPGNGGISQIADLVPIKPDNIPEMLEYAQKEKIDLTIVGPEVPLGLGIVDEFIKNNLQIFGPNKNAARLETSKAFARDFCQKYNLPSPAYEKFTDSKKAKDYLSAKSFPIVIKADGLAAGKGAIIVHNKQEAHITIERILDKKEFGQSGNTIVIEDFLTGQEVSMLVLCDGNTIMPIIPARDHKPIFDGNQGPNTGGMGSYAPIPDLGNDFTSNIQTKLFDPMLRALKKENIEYKGVLYAGLMISGNDFNIVEFNCRWGDPEAEVLIPLLKTDMVSLCLDTIEGKLKQLEWQNKYALTVIAASDGYPQKYETNKLITGDLSDTEDTIIFHCGTKKENNNFYTTGGRVLSITGLGNSLVQARARSYKKIKQIQFDNIYYRTDIGNR
ncbi:MAG: phosphoribosylamine--glycine ligase [Candidatus Latescibacteria bacterium]|nr:phosphoribosylamine--glycine ligase [Candidatus Latescibacterota bacterium]